MKNRLLVPKSPMSHSRSTIITEDLGPLRKRYKDKPEHIRLRALELLQKNPAMTHQQVAERLGLSKPTIDRWWGIYRKSGIEGLLAIGERKKRSAARSTATPTPALPGSESLVRLMNAMPLALDVTEAVDVLRTEFRKILPDVDRVVIGVDTAFDLIDPEQYQPDLDAMQDVTAGETEKSRLVVKNVDELDSPAAGSIEFLRQQGHPVDEYHPPAYFEVRYIGPTPIGTMLLWRERSKNPVSQRTIDIVTRLLPFLGYALSNIVARQNLAAPGDRIFHTALRKLSSESDLSLQERRVVIYRLYGHSYKVIAGEMGVTEDTIKKHLNAVYRKTKTSGHAELFAKYFAPLILPKSDPVKT